MIDYELIPEGVAGALIRYLEQGLPPGSFLEAVLSNDLFAACAQADTDSMRGLPSLVAWLHNNSPGSSHGSPGIYRAWLYERQHDEAERGGEPPRCHSQFDGYDQLRLHGGPGSWRKELPGVSGV